jgi:hypothetical protein
MHGNGATDQPGSATPTGTFDSSPRFAKTLFLPQLLTRIRLESHPLNREDGQFCCLIPSAISAESSLFLVRNALANASVAEPKPHSDLP